MEWWLLQKSIQQNSTKNTNAEFVSQSLKDILSFGENLFLITINLQLFLSNSTPKWAQFPAHYIIHCFWFLLTTHELCHIQCKRTTKSIGNIKLDTKDHQSSPKINHVIMKYLICVKPCQLHIFNTLKWLHHFKPHFPAPVFYNSLSLHVFCSFLVTSEPRCPFCITTVLFSIKFRAL